MLWFFIALIGYLLLAVVFVLDKFILSESVERPEIYTFYSTVFLFGILVAYPFGVGLLSGLDWLWATVSGVGFGLAMWTMFIALKYGETSHISPFIGVITALATYTLSYGLFSERLGTLQMVGVGILVLAGCLLSLEKRRGKKAGFHAGFLWGILSGALFAISHVSAKFIYEGYDFLTGFVWTRASTGLVGLLLVLLYPSVRAKCRGAMQRKKKKTVSFAKKHTMGIVVSDKVLGALGVVFIQYAIAIGSVTLVNAMAGLQYVFMFVIVLLMTKFAPKIFKEYFTKKELAIQLVALVLVVVGSAMFVL